MINRVINLTTTTFVRQILGHRTINRISRDTEGKEIASCEAGAESSYHVSKSSSKENYKI